MVLSGSIDDVLKQLQDQIEELKAAKPSDSAKERLQATSQALEALMKVKKSLDGAADRQQLLQVKLLKAAEATEAAAEINKLNQGLSRLKGNLESTLKEYGEIQERIRKLGGNAGGTPVLGWHQAHTNSTKRFQTYDITRPVHVERAYTVTKPSHTELFTATNPVKVERVYAFTKPEQAETVTATKSTKTEKVIKPTAKQKDAFKKLMEKAIEAYAEGRFAECEALAKKAMELDPGNVEAARVLLFKAQTETRFTPDVAKPKGGSSSASDQGRIDALEKKLKALQAEVEGFRKGQK